MDMLSSFEEILRELKKYGRVKKGGADECVMEKYYDTDMLDLKKMLNKKYGKNIESGDNQTPA